MAGPKRYIDEEDKKRRRKSNQLKYRLGIDIKVWDEMYNNQKGCCKTCGTHQSELNRPLNVDHNHATGKVRGLLCFQCNISIGYLKENIETLQNIIKYLEE